MYYLPIADQIAEERRKDYLRDAERMRVFAALRGGSIRIAAVRRPFGAAMVRAGERLQRPRARAAERPLPYGGEVRLAR
jgi:hypothetical protein